MSLKFVTNLCYPNVVLITSIEFTSNDSSVFRMLGFKVRVFFRRKISNGFFLSSWRMIPANSLPVGLLTGRVFDRQVYTRLTLTVDACCVVSIQWGFPRIIMLL